MSTDSRGRDLVAAQEVDGELVPLGAAFVRFAGSIADVAAWAAVAGRLGPDRMVLAGHSMGRAKAVRALPATTAAGLLLLSPAHGAAEQGHDLAIKQLRAGWTSGTRSPVGSSTMRATTSVAMRARSPTSRRSGWPDCADPPTARNAGCVGL
jgi:alpha-beta hydrolase superfamily lysophospholipase